MTDFGWLTPDYLIKIIQMVEDGVINKGTGEKLVFYYMSRGEVQWTN